MKKAAALKDGLTGKNYTPKPGGRLRVFAGGQYKLRSRVVFSLGMATHPLPQVVLTTNDGGQSMPLVYEFNLKK